MPDKNKTDKAYTFFMGKNLLGIKGETWFEEYQDDTECKKMLSFADYLYCVWIDAGLDPYGIDWNKIATRIAPSKKN